MFKYDTHVHTKETSKCGRLKGEEVVRLYRDAGYDGLIITDHFCRGFFDTLKNMSWSERIDCFLAGYKAALVEGDRIGLKVLLGIELQFDDVGDDILIYGVDERFLKQVVEPYKIGLEGFRKLAREQGAFINQAHPYRDGAVPSKPTLLDGIEVYNPNQRHENRNELAYKLAQELGVKMTSGSDCHRLEDAARAGMIIPENIDTSSEFVTLLKNDRIIKLIGEEEL